MFCGNCFNPKQKGKMIPDIYKMIPPITCPLPFTCTDTGSKDKTIGKS